MNLQLLATARMLVCASDGLYKSCKLVSFVCIIYTGSCPKVEVKDMHKSIWVENLR